MLPSLLAMVVVAAASALIYWSAPLERSASALPLPTAPAKNFTEKSLTAAAALEPMVTLAPAAEPAPAELLINAALSNSDLTNAALSNTAPADPLVEPESPAASIAAETASPQPGSSATRADQLAGERAEQDLLTGLLAPECFFTRFTARLARCGAAGQTAVLVICDLDQFGELNRSAGLVDANRLLRCIADCFRLTVREGDLLARLGGDEFALFFPGLSPEIAEARVRDLRAAVREAALLTLTENQQRVTISVGISCFPRDGETGEVLFEAADVALNAAKRLRAEQAGQPIPSALVLTRNDAPVLKSLRTESY